MVTLPFGEQIFIDDVVEMTEEKLVKVVKFVEVNMTYRGSPCNGILYCS